ncbi:hypothetical protein ACN1T8_001465 [Vibrio cholerae]|uniref:hypothetical protein n=1 Tax=Vibrio cholerae TaxID=666 RepID=UPI001C92D1E9|nr:hypothetical protein [Vibrio cholerae]MBY4642111.1 hypothetical protein [Vibrio cholerae]MCR9658383.1 hypothetical protein [Vibrio cholerae]MCR9689065.1 hypothetical protein [Vibrio cholerae]MCR9737572.1 hypothetical protein [Vibrio cholerae]MCR9746396.1 hypothetical protein [Vibrio cholerae]
MSENEIEMFIKDFNKLSIMTGVSCICSLLVLILIGYEGEYAWDYSWAMIIVVIVFGLFSHSRAVLLWKDVYMKGYDSKNIAMASYFFIFSGVHMVGFFISAFAIYHFMFMV